MPTAPTLYGRGHQPRETGNRPIRPLRGGHLCLDFINTVSDHNGLPAEDDLSPGYVNLVEWARRAGALADEETTRLLRTASREPRDAAAVRKRAIALREALFGIVLALTAGEQPAAGALDLLDGELRDAARHGRFVPAGSRLTWQWATDAQLDRILWPVCEAAVSLLTGDGLDRVRQCEAPGCQGFFLDRSKNGSRRFCSTTRCGTADRVRRFRERQKPSP
jgi:predicted RNA-binding Zn ribbon-like protein